MQKQVQNSFESGGFGKAVDTAKQFDTTYFANVRQKFKNSRRTDGHSCKAVQVLQRSLEYGDKFLIFN